MPGGSRAPGELDGIDLEIERIRVEGELIGAGLVLGAARHGGDAPRESVRLFVAAYPPEPVCAHLGEAVDALAIGRAAAAGVNARLAARDNWHVTLAFLGDVPDERRPEVDAAIGRAVRDWQAASTGRRAATGGQAATGRRAATGRLTRAAGCRDCGWPGAGGSAEAGSPCCGSACAATWPRWPRSATAIRRELKRARLPFDPKPFRPHLTLARPGDRIDVAGDVDGAARATRVRCGRLDELRLMRSHLGPRPTYDRLAAWPLGAGAAMTTDGQA